ncbi:hypothetical protein M9Y10_032244 [Tritrichomonas musculus]|uniref:beta-galactosidase n=1 Tax=Tritrichomonas musculus TaxID=1915356 RepID=A0ABR2GZH2_9EUKA
MKNLEYYKDIEIPSVNREKPRTSFISHDNRDEAIINITNFEKSPYYINLNGKWEFYFNEYPKKIPKDIATNINQNDPEWGEIKVPGNWERQGYGTAIYTDGNYDFCPMNPQPPYLPDLNPTGVYRRKDIKIPQEWFNQERDIFLQVGGARGGLYVYVNGQEIGYNEDSKNPAEFLLNKYVHPVKENVITLLIHKYCTGSYLEDQDMWRLGGLERDVYIYSQPKIHIRDFKVVSTLDDEYENGIFKLNVYLVNHDEENKAEVKIGYELIDFKNDQKIVLKGEKEAVIDIDKETEIQFNEEEPIEKVNKWSAEHPNLYTLLITLRSKSDKSIIEIVSFRVGFRREEIAKIFWKEQEMSVLLFNGKTVTFKGVNIHEHDEKTGHYVTDELRLKDIELLKKNNFNALRFSHYPNCRRLYELCDEYGFYVYSECNIESHGMGFKLNTTLANKPIWLNAHMERTMNMYERAKNHACVTFLSLGNEAGNGSNFFATYNYMKEQEKNAQNRPVVYECVMLRDNTDIHVPMYLSDTDFEDFGVDFHIKPTIACEYEHSMGNSNGNFNQIWDVIYKYPNLQGGFIWDWVDQGFLEIGKGGRKYWTFGGDYGNKCPSSGNHCINGCVSPDRTPHPAMAEIKYSQQNIGFKAIDIAKGTFVISNRFYFTDLHDYEIICLLKKNEKVLKEINLNDMYNELSSLGPQESVSIDIHSEISSLKPEINTEYFLNFVVLAKTDNQPFIPKGFIVAHDQFRLPIEPLARTVKKEEGPSLKINDNSEMVTICSEKVEFVFSKTEKIVKSYKVDGFEYISKGFGFQPNFWRGPTDNDYGNGAPSREQFWKEMSHEFKINECQATIENNVANLTVIYVLDEDCFYEVNYQVLSTGIVNVKAYYTCTQKDEYNESDCIPRIGLRFRIPVELHNVDYFGRGPEENYCDRCSGTQIDLYKTTAEDLYFPYVRPQENGHHIDTRWLAVHSSNENGLIIRADDKFEFNALRNPVEDFDDEDQKNLKYQKHYFGWPESGKNKLKRQHHIDDVVPQNYVELNIDLKQEGVAGFNSWGDRPGPEFSVLVGEDHSYGFTLIPYKKENEIAEKLAFIYQ